jgi:hypothetical protein
VARKGIIVASETLEAVKRQAKANEDALTEIRNAGGQTAELIKQAAIQAKALTDSAQAAKESAEAARIDAMATENGSMAAAESARAAKISADALMYSQRPWIAMKAAISGPLTFDKDGAHIHVGVRLRNVGHMPARGVWLHPVLSVEGDPTAQRKRICSELSPGIRQLGPVVFPGDSVMQQWHFSASAKDIEARCREIFGEIEPPFVPLNVILVAQYTTGIDPNVTLYTAAIYELSRIENGVPVALKPENTPVSSLRMELSTLAGVIAE